MSQAALDPHAAVVGTAGGVAEGALTTVDGKPLKASLAAANAHRRRRAFLLVLPLLLFVLVTFIVPIGQLLLRSVSDPRFIEYEDLGTGEVTPVMANLREWFAANPQGT